ncbi:restriction endonuclease subunit S [Prevotella sp.]|uniref:restriction endonuclease subunit S n=1 Tax=Prevotella sp. TaxID=59823 RepID=UPI0025834752|nr:restriction endonuclease subunit S [Prevotella sp.]
MEWIVKRSSELYVSSSGLSKASDQFGYGFPFLSYKDVFNNYYTPEKLNTLVNSTEKDRQKCSVKRGDVFLTRTSETTDELGMSCVALKDYENATFNGFTKRLRPLTEEIVPEYAAYFFRSSYFRAQCQSLASLITRASLNDGMIRRFKIRFPKEKKCQEKIGKILLTYDSLIENNTKRIRILEKMAENLYKEWFVRFRFPGHENVKMVNGLPNGWKKGALSDVCEFKRGKNITSSEMKDGTIPVISAGITPSGFHSHANVYGISVTMSSSGANAGYIAVHYSDIWAADCSYIEEASTPYIYYVYELLNNIRSIINNFQRGAAQPHVYPRDINRIKMIIPSEDIRKKANEKIGVIHCQINNLQRQNSLLARQRDLLLPRLMSGKLEV